jgi:hypothetical protein
MCLKARKSTQFHEVRQIQDRLKASKRHSRTANCKSQHQPSQGLQPSFEQRLLPFQAPMLVSMLNIQSVPAGRRRRDSMAMTTIHSIHTMPNPTTQRPEFDPPAPSQAESTPVSTHLRPGRNPRLTRTPMLPRRAGLEMQVGVNLEVEAAEAAVKWWWWWKPVRSLRISRGQISILHFEMYAADQQSGQMSSVSPQVVPGAVHDVHSRSANCHRRRVHVRRQTSLRRGESGDQGLSTFVQARAKSSIATTTSNALVYTP